MGNLRTLIWLGIGIALAVAGWFLVAPLVVPPDWSIAAEEPRVIGHSDDAFSYNGEGSIRPVAGEGRLRIATNGQGSLRLSLRTSEADPPLSLREGALVGENWTLIASVGPISDVWISVPVHGDTGIGDNRLPETVALIAGRSQFDLIVDGVRRLSDLAGYWSIADALRQDDGSIRQQGLVFSPLLRDKTGFSDPTRLELTLLLYEKGMDDDVLLHVVFQDVHVERSLGTL